MSKSANVPIFVPHAGCPHRCGFCNQRGISGVQGIPDDWAVAYTLRAAAESLGERMRRTGREITCQIAFFGGSFTAIPRAEMLRLLRAARPFLEQDIFDGIRISTRPDAIDGEVLDILREHGVTAIELGTQSMDDGVLKASGRGHTAEQVALASRMIRDGGFALGLQMMTGLPESDETSDLATSAAIAALLPDTVRIYPTLVLKGTPFAERWRAGEYRPQALPDAVALGARLLEFFTDRGIPVIRLGLHDSPTLAEELLAGPSHTAFRELCEGEVLLDRTLRQLDGIPSGELKLAVAPGAVSKMAGQRRCNLVALEHRGYCAKITEDATVPYLQVRIVT